MMNKIRNTKDIASLRGIEGIISKDYFSNTIDGQVNITTSLRQPGSSMKPLVYAASFLRGYTPDTILYDVITNFSNINN